MSSARRADQVATRREATSFDSTLLYANTVYKKLAEREAARYELAHGRFPRFPSPDHVFYSVQKSLAHRTSNRYSNVTAYDRTAVEVNGVYLNANVVTDGRGASWIAAQAPPPGAFFPFFTAIRTGAAPQNSRPTSAILVQLTGWEDNGIPKADPYLPNCGETLTFKSSGGSISLSSEEQTREQSMSSTITRLNLDDMTLWHYYFDAWSDHSVPKGEAVGALRRLVDEVERRRVEDGCEVWVHCSAGVGRTGTFIALTSLLHSKGKATRSSPMGALGLDDEVALTVDYMRESRGMLVQGPDQLRLIYQMTSG